MRKILILLLFSNFANAQTILQKGFAQKLLAEKLNPTSMTFDHHGNLFLAQKDGRVLLLKNDETMLADPVLTLAVDDLNERGINGIALHPDFDNDPWLYVFYTAPQTDRNRVSRFRMNGYFAVPGSEQILFEFDPMDGQVHNGGGMAFDSEGYLFVGHGDGGKSANAQNLNTTLGKIIRLDANGMIPGDNPFFANSTGSRRAIFAYGLRNPFAMTFQKTSGKILISDVGAGGWEEVNAIEKGKNYGWNKVEGPIQNGTVPPADYQDPLFAYPHSDGCAIIGAAVYEPDNQQFPQNFGSKFFFADYCRGYLKTLDLATAQPDSVPFATGLKQPVAFAVRPDGSLFYLMRSGIGGGSVIDNTGTSNGTLWKIFYTGSGAPTISVDPRPQLISDGEAAEFEVQVLGTPPFQFFWEKNGQILTGNFSEKLTLPPATLADSGSVFRCIVQNLEGADTSAAAVLQVTANRRPEPQIIFPTENSKFAAGDTIHFEGWAADFEDGNLPADRLAWRVEFHHDQHVHPTMPTTTGIFSGKIAVPLAGETSENVWFRISLTATDVDGLSKTTTRDVLPDLRKIRVESNFPLPLNVDGVVRPMPFEFQSLRNQTRNLLVSNYLEKNDSIFIFKNWENGDTAALRSVAAPADSLTHFFANFDLFTRGRGTGLHGEYFLDPEFDLDDLPVFLRLDTVINFNWGDDSPHPTLPGNGYTIRWTGFVQPVFSEKYSFHVRSDDGCRLFIADSLLIDKWKPQAPTENTGAVELVGGKKYPIRLEFLEIGGGAEIALRWSSARTPKELVPKKQLYPPDPFAPAAVSGRVWKDLNYNGSPEVSEPALLGTTVLLFSKKDSSLIGTQVVDNQGKYKFKELTPATYFLRFVPAVTAGNLMPWTSLSAFASTDSLHLAPLQSLVLDAAFVLPPTTIGGVCWHDKNADGQPQTSEPLLENMSVLLFDAADTTLLGVEQTDVFGKYFFNFLPSGEYLLQFVAPPGLAGLSPAGGQISASGESQIFDLQQGENFGLQVPWREATARIEGRIWLDANQNHFPDLTESGIGQVSVLLFRAADSSLVFAKTTAADGRFEMLPLPAGKYFFQFVAGLAGSDLLPGVGISAAGFSPFFELKIGQSAQLNFSFVPKTSAAGEAENLQGLAIFPNPSAGEFWLQVFENQEFNLKFFDAVGRPVFPKTVFENGWLRLDFTALPTGFYFLKIFENGRSRSARLVVER